MTIINYDPKTTGRFTKLALAIFVCTTFIRLCGIFYIILGALMIAKNGVLHREAFPLLNQFVINGMPLGNLSAGLIYALFFLFPLHTIFGLLGFFGVYQKNKVFIIIYTCFLLFGVVVDILCIVLFSMLLCGINSWIETRFKGYYNDFKKDTLNNEVYSSFRDLINAMDCDVTVKNIGCWEKYYPVMDSNLSIFISLLSISIVLEIINVVFSEVTYRRLDRSKESPGMFNQFRLFVQRSWNTCRMKFVFVLVQIGDTICSAVLLIGGIVITQSRFITDTVMLPVFENMRFNNYYLPDIVIGFTATMILIGCLNIFSYGLGFNMLCYNSETKTKVHVAFQVVMVMMVLITVIFWLNLLISVGTGMSEQLFAEFLVYGDTTYTVSHYTKAWNAIFLTFRCCGVGNGSFIGTIFGDSHGSDDVPSQCGTTATLANSKTDPSFTTTKRQSAYSTVCETPLKDEVESYAMLFGFTCGVLLVLKICNIVLIYKNALGVELPVEQQSSIWKTLKDSISTSPKRLFGFMAFTGLGLVLALGVMISGVLLRFTDLLGHKDIHKLFKHIYISGFDVTYLVTTMSDIMLCSGTASFVFFFFGIISFAAKATAMYYVSTVILMLSVLFKFICVMVWIPTRIYLDNDLEDAMYDTLRTYYVTDKPHTPQYMEEWSLGFNTLFYLGKCCLPEPSFFSQQYYSSYLIELDAPWTCRKCDNEPTVRWPKESTITAECSLSTFSKNCTTAILDETIHKYDTTAVGLSCLMIILEVILIVVLDRAYKSRVSPGQSRGLISNTCFNNRFINNDKMPNFTLLTVVYVSGSIALSVIQLSAWIAIIIYVCRGDTQLDTLHIGMLNLGEMTKGACITILVVIPLSIIVSVFKIRWCLIKWNTGLRWSFLPEAVLLAIDLVIFCLFAQQLEKIRSSGENIYRVNYQINFSYLCVSIFMQVSLIIIKDRLHKRIDTSLSKPRPSGMFTALWRGVVTHRYFTDSGKTNKQLLGFVFLSLFYMIIQLSAWIAIIIYVHRGDTQLDTLHIGMLNLGEMTKGACITILVVIPLSIIVSVFKIRWCLIKWNTGLRLSLLPEAGLLVIDLVIFCLFAQQLEKIRSSGQNIYRVMYQINFSYLCVSIFMQVSLIIIKDRLHKRIDTSLSKPRPSGMFTALWRYTQRYFTDSGRTNKQLLGFVFLSVFLVIIQLSAWIAITIYVCRGDTQLDTLHIGMLNLGEMTKGACITILVVIPLSIIVTVFKIRWCLVKWNTGLRWSLLPEAGLLVIDIVIFCLFAQQLEKIRTSGQNIYRVMYQINFAYLCVNIFMRVTLIIIKDRLHKRIDTSLSNPRPSGMFTTLWREIITHRYFTNSGKTNKQLLGFVFLSIFLMVWEICTWVAAFLQQFALSEQDNISDTGFMFRMLVFTTLATEMIYIITHVVTIVLAIQQNKVFFYQACGLLVVVLLADVVMIALTGVLLDNLRNDKVGKLYDLSGTFIGITVWHAVMLVPLIYLCIRLAGRVTNTSHISPLEEEVEFRPGTVEGVREDRSSESSLRPQSETLSVIEIS